MISERETTLVTSMPVVLRLHKLAATGKLASEEDLAELRQMMEAEQGEFVEWLEGSEAVSGEYALQYLRVCLLVRLGFEPYEMINLLGISPTNLCNIRRRLLKRLFGVESTAKKFDQRIKAWE